MNNDAKTVLAALQILGVSIEPGPGGPVDAAVGVDELTCKVGEGETRSVDCTAKVGELVYKSSDARLLPAVDILLAAAGHTESLHVRALQCFRNSLPVANPICGMMVAP
jgi:hypothetical protein